jgi:hypothetical protein
MRAVPFSHAFFTRTEFPHLTVRQNKPRDDAQTGQDAVAGFVARLHRFAVGALGNGAVGQGEPGIARTLADPGEIATSDLEDQRRQLDGHGIWFGLTVEAALSFDGH